MKVSRIAAPIAAALAMLPAVALANPEAEGHGGIEWITPVFGSTGKLGLVWIIISFLTYSPPTFPGFAENRPFGAGKH